MQEFYSALHGTPDLLLTLSTRKQIAPSTRIKDSSIKGVEENSSAYILLTTNYFVENRPQHILMHISANQAVFHTIADCVSQAFSCPI